MDILARDMVEYTANFAEDGNSQNLMEIHPVVTVYSSVGSTYLFSLSNHTSRRCTPNIT